jgi:long-chain fatty acid transport protein
LKKKAFRFIGTLLMCLTAASIAFGGGYQINEHGARATGMGGAFVAQASDPSAIFFNAAGLGFQNGINVLAGTTLIFPSTTFTGPTPLTTETKMVSQTFYPSSLYGSYAVNDQWVVGLGVYTPYGLGTEWPNDWVGKELFVKADLKTYYINPTVAYKVSNQLAFGAGVSMVFGSAKISYRVKTMSSLGVYSALDGTASLDGTGNGVSVNVGAMYKPMEKLSLGAAFRSLTNLKFSGTASFTDMQALQAYFPGGDGNVTLPMPANLQVGAAYVVDPKLTVEADFQYTFWSAYKNLEITLATGPNAPAPLGGQPLQKSPAPSVKNWDDGFLGRIGAEYKLDDRVQLRLGYVRDISPQPPSKMEPMLPDANRNDITVGGSCQVSERFFVDVSYMLVLFADRTAVAADTPLPGTYKSSANLVSVNLGYHF